MAKFKCKHSGSIYEYTTEHDIRTMREHQEYEEVVEEKVEETPAPAPKKTAPKAKAE